MKKLSVFLLIINLFALGEIDCFAQSDTASATVGNIVNVFPFDSNGYGNPQVEVSISADKTNPNYLIMSANTDAEGNFSQGYYYSQDGGNTWSGNDVFPDTSSFLKAVGGDPSTAIDADGNMYMATMNYLNPLSNWDKDIPSPSLIL